MSLINQMLKDLEARQGLADLGEREDPLQGIAPAREGGRSRSLFGLAAGLILLGAVLAGLAWHFHLLGRQASMTPRETPAALVREAVIPVPPVPPTSPPAPAVQAEPNPVIPPPAQESPPPAADPQPSPPSAAEIAVPASPKAELPAPIPDPIQSRPVPIPAPAPKIAAAEFPAAVAGPVPVTAAGSAGVTKHPTEATPRERADRHFREALTAFREGRGGSGIQSLQAALTLDPSHHEARLLLADRLRAGGMTGKAGNLLAEGLALEPGTPALRAAYSRLLIDGNRLEEARTALLAGAQPAVGEDPDHFLMLAAVYQRLGQFDQAVAAYREVLGQRPGSGRGWLGLAIALESAGQPEEAAAAYRRALTGDGLEGPSRDFAGNRLTVLQAGTSAAKGGQGRP